MEKQKLTQCDKILRHMKDYGTIDPLTALSEYGIIYNQDGIIVEQIGFVRENK